MARISVPEGVHPGFKIITNLSDEQLEKLSLYLRDNVIGQSVSSASFELSELLATNGEDLMNTIISFQELVRDSSRDVADLSKRLAETYKDRVGLNSKELSRLKNNLHTILSNYGGIRMNVKINEHQIENKNFIDDLKIYTDLRIIDKSLELTEKVPNYATIIHSLYIDFIREEPITIVADINRLQILKEQIEKAIEREEIIKNNVSDSFTLV